MEATVNGCVFTTRKDKQKDRVEIDPQQLSEAMIKAENSGQRVIGWAHSHPNITVFPSHVDVGTQHNQQLYADPLFFGLIISCFNSDSELSQFFKSNQRVQLTCFQAEKDEMGQLISQQIPLFVIPVPSLDKTALTQVSKDILQMLFDEQLEAFNAVHSNTDSNFSPSFAYHSSIYTQNISLMVDRFGVPLMATLKDRLERNERLIQELSATEK
ncbi:BRCA1 BRCA2-containing complex, subunit 3 [Nowakowskiella sp. JEL0078]|nr:BRCA1 BRCA2-containing complex, subunit 3 [Nowakowskiella sp. JEL0078]